MPSTGIIALTTILMFLGVAGTVIPGLPGIGLIFLGVLVYAWATGFTVITPLTVVLFGVVALLAWGADLFGSLVGAKVGGGKKWALIGTIGGALVGIMAGPAGLLLGAFMGGFAGALIEGSSQQQALKVALYSTLGVIGATVFQIVIALAMIVAFLVAVFV